MMMEVWVTSDDGGVVTSDDGGVVTSDDGSVGH